MKNILITSLMILSVLSISGCNFDYLKSGKELKKEISQIKKINPYGFDGKLDKKLASLQKAFYNTDEGKAQLKADKIHNDKIYKQIAKDSQPTAKDKKEWKKNFGENWND